MEIEQRRPFWNLIAIALHVVGVISAFAAAYRFGDPESLDGLFFMIPTYAFFCLLALVAAVVSGIRNERLQVLTTFVLFGSLLVFLVLLRLIIARWSLGVQFWKQKL